MTGHSATPERVKLVVDLDEGRLAAGSVTRSLAGPTPTPDQVLATYLSLVYTLRNTEPGTRVTLRTSDLDVLAEVLRLSEPDVQRRLVGLMSDPNGEISTRTRLLRRKVLLPVLGIVVAVTAAGAILLVVDGDAPPPEPAAPPAAEVVPPVTPGDAPVDIGSAASQTPNADGSVSRILAGDGITAAELGPNDVGIGSPQVAIKGPDGEIIQTERNDDTTTTTTTPG